MSSEEDTLPEPEEGVDESEPADTSTSFAVRDGPQGSEPVQDDDSEEDDESGSGSSSDGDEDDDDGDGDSEAEEGDDDGDDEGDEDASSSDEEDDNENDDQEVISSDDEDTVRCPICFLKLTNTTREVGNPEPCDHLFCFECIFVWSKTVNTCPIDRQEFRLILVRNGPTGGVIRNVSVGAPNARELIVVPDEDDDVTYCEVCGQCNREDRLLLCDGCDLGYHLECLDPPLSSVPIEAWYCPDCDAVNRRTRFAREAGINEDQLLALMTDGEETSMAALQLRAQQRRRQHQVVPRTLQAQRVRAIIDRNRSFRDGALSPLSETIEAVANGAGEISQPSSSSVRRTTTTRRKTRKRKTGKKRKSTSASASSKKTAGTKKRKSTRRTKKKVKRLKKKSGFLRLTRNAPSANLRRVGRQTVRSAPLSSKCRIAAMLGLRMPSASAGNFVRLTPPDFRPNIRGSINGVPAPLSRRDPASNVSSLRGGSDSMRNLNLLRYRSGIPTLDLFGAEDPIFDHEDETTMASSSSGSVAMVHRSVSTSVVLSRLKSTSATAPRRRSPDGESEYGPATPSTSSTSFDLVGSILSTQDTFLAKDTRFSVSPYGKVTAMRSAPAPGAAAGGGGGVPPKKRAVMEYGSGGETNGSSGSDGGSPGGSSGGDGGGSAGVPASSGDNLADGGRTSPVHDGAAAGGLGGSGGAEDGAGGGNSGDGGSPPPFQPCSSPPPLSASKRDKRRNVPLASPSQIDENYSSDYEEYTRQRQSSPVAPAPSAVVHPSGTRDELVSVVANERAEEPDLYSDMEVRSSSDEEDANEVRPRVLELPIIRATQSSLEASEAIEGSAGINGEGTPGGTEQRDEPSMISDVSSAQQSQRISSPGLNSVEKPLPSVGNSEVPATEDVVPLLPPPSFPLENFGLLAEEVRESRDQLLEQSTARQQTVEETGVEVAEMDKEPVPEKPDTAEHHDESEASPQVLKTQYAVEKTRSEVEEATERTASGTFPEKEVRREDVPAAAVDDGLLSDRKRSSDALAPPPDTESISDNDESLEFSFSEEGEISEEDHRRTAPVVISPSRIQLPSGSPASKHRTVVLPAAMAVVSGVDLEEGEILAPDDDLPLLSRSKDPGVTGAGKKGLETGGNNKKERRDKSPVVRRRHDSESPVNPGAGGNVWRKSTAKHKDRSYRGAPAPPKPPQTEKEPTSEDPKKKKKRKIDSKRRGTPSRMSDEDDGSPPPAPTTTATTANVASSSSSAPPPRKKTKKKELERYDVRRIVEGKKKAEKRGPRRPLSPLKPETVAGNRGKSPAVVQNASSATASSTPTTAAVAASVKPLAESSPAKKAKSPKPGGAPELSKLPRGNRRRSFSPKSSPESTPDRLRRRSRNSRSRSRSRSRSWLNRRRGSPIPWDDDYSESNRRWYNESGRRGSRDRDKERDRERDRDRWRSSITPPPRSNYPQPLMRFSSSRSPGGARRRRLSRTPPPQRNLYRDSRSPVSRKRPRVSPPRGEEANSKTRAGGVGANAAASKKKASANEKRKGRASRSPPLASTSNQAAVKASGAASTAKKKKGKAGNKVAEVTKAPAAVQEPPAKKKKNRRSPSPRPASSSRGRRAKNDSSVKRRAKSRSTSKRRPKSDSKNRRRSRSKSPSYSDRSCSTCSTLYSRSSYSVSSDYSRRRSSGGRRRRNSSRYEDGGRRRSRSSYSRSSYSSSLSSLSLSRSPTPAAKRDKRRDVAATRDASKKKNKAANAASGKKQPPSPSPKEKKKKKNANVRRETRVLSKKVISEENRLIVNVSYAEEDVADEVVNDSAADKNAVDGDYDARTKRRGLENGSRSAKKDSKSQKSSGKTSAAPPSPSKKGRRGDDSPRRKGPTTPPAPLASGDEDGAVGAKRKKKKKKNKDYDGDRDEDNRRDRSRNSNDKRSKRRDGQQRRVVVVDLSDNDDAGNGADDDIVVLEDSPHRGGERRNASVQEITLPPAGAPITPPLPATSSAAHQQQQPIVKFTFASARLPTMRGSNILGQDAESDEEQPQQDAARQQQRPQHSIFPLAPPPAVPESLLQMHPQLPEQLLPAAGLLQQLTTAIAMQQQLQLQQQQQQQKQQLLQQQQESRGDETYDPFEPTNSPSPPPEAPSPVDGTLGRSMNEEVSRDSAGTPVQDEHFRLDEDDRSSERRLPELLAVEQQGADKDSTTTSAAVTAPAATTTPAPAALTTVDDVTDMFAPSPVPTSTASLPSIVRVESSPSSPPPTISASLGAAGTSPDEPLPPVAAVATPVATSSLTPVAGTPVPVDQDIRILTPTPTPGSAAGGIFIANLMPSPASISASTPVLSLPPPTTTTRVVLPDMTIPPPLASLAAQAPPPLPPTVAVNLSSMLQAQAVPVSEVAAGRPQPQFYSQAPAVSNVKMPMPTVKALLDSISKHQQFAAAKSQQQHAAKNQQLASTSAALNKSRSPIYSPSSPYSPGSSEGDDLFEPPPDDAPSGSKSKPDGYSRSRKHHANAKPSAQKHKGSSSHQQTRGRPSAGQAKGRSGKDAFDALFGGAPSPQKRAAAAAAANAVKRGPATGSAAADGHKRHKVEVKGGKENSHLQINEDLPSSAVELQVKEKFLEKVQRQNHAAEEVKTALRPFYSSRKIDKDTYKAILGKCVPKICRNKKPIDPVKVQKFVNVYVQRELKKRKKSHV